MNNTKPAKQQISEPDGLHCPICHTSKMQIDQLGWFHCRSCCSLSSEAMERLLCALPNIERFSMARFERMATDIAKKFGFTIDDVRGEMRSNAISECRRAIYYRLRQEGLSFSQIGRICRKDHTSVMYGCKKVMGGLKAKAA